MMNTANRFTVHTERSCYSTREIGADTLVDLVVEAADYGDGTLALLWDGDISHYCSTTCLRGGLANLTPINLWLIATKERGHHVEGQWMRDGNSAELIWDHTDENLWCDECKERIGQHFGECVVCEDELLTETFGYREDHIGEWYDGSGEYKFAGLCNQCSNGLVTEEERDEIDPPDQDMRDRVLCAILALRVTDGYYSDEDMLDVIVDDDLWSAIESRRTLTTKVANGEERLPMAVGPDALELLAYAPTTWTTNAQRLARAILGTAVEAEGAARTAVAA